MGEMYASWLNEETLNYSMYVFSIKRNLPITEHLSTIYVVIQCFTECKIMFDKYIWGRILRARLRFIMNALFEQYNVPSHLSMVI